MIDSASAISTLRTLPYRRGSFAARNWGHPFHSLISYPSKLKPSLAYFLIRYFTSDEDRVLDPFSGVGTIPFEACLQGRVGVGSDINPLAYHATRAKVDPPTLREARAVLVSLESTIEVESRKATTEGVEPEIVPFFHETTLRELVVAKRFFTNRDDRASSFVLTCLLHILHGNRPYALSRRSHNIMPWPPKGEFVYKPVMTSLREKVERMLNDPIPIGFVRGEANVADVYALPFETDSVDAILTSPPFHANRDFLRMNRIRLWFCGWDYSEQEAKKPSFVENRDIGCYDQVFKEFDRVLKSGGACVLHLGVVKQFDMGEVLAPLAQRVGFSHLATIGEDTRDLESHGIRARGATHTHELLILRTA